MNDHSHHTTILTSQRTALMQSLRDKDWKAAEQITADMQKELLALQCWLIVQDMVTK